MSTEQSKPATETKAANPATPKPFAFDKQKCLDHIVRVEEYYMQFAGKKGMNPFFFLHKHVNPLQKRLNAVTTEETPKDLEMLQSQILALPMSEDNITKLPVVEEQKYSAVGVQPPKPLKH
jgi:hypothetical protein